MTATHINLSEITLARLSSMPKPGGTHLWLSQIAGGLKRVLPPDRCSAFLRRCCDELVTHRAIPDREINDAVEFAYGLTGNREQTDSTKWPAANADFIARVVGTVEPVFDGETDTGLGVADVLPLLFRPGELVCTGADSKRAVIRPVEEAVADADTMQFVCVNPMRGPIAVNHSGRPSVRCQNNVLLRRYLVAEFDDATITKRQQAQFATLLGRLAPLVMAVDSGGKSLHTWYFVQKMGPKDQLRFFAAACMLGADVTRWDCCGWVRMPGGRRLKDDGTRVRQRILYWNPEALAQKGGPCGHGTETTLAA